MSYQIIKSCINEAQCKAAVPLGSPAAEQGWCIKVWCKVVGGPFPTPSSLPPDGGHPGFSGQGVCREVPPFQVKCQGSSSRSSLVPEAPSHGLLVPTALPGTPQAAHPGAHRSLQDGGFCWDLTFPGTRTALLESGPKVSPLTWVPKPLLCTLAEGLRFEACTENCPPPAPDSTKWPSCCGWVRGGCGHYREKVQGPRAQKRPQAVHLPK